MLFNSHIFIFVFLPLCLAGWFLLNRFRLYKISNIFLIGMSLWFYGYFNQKYLILITASILINYTISFLMEKFAKAEKVFFFAGLMLNILVLGYFKYYDFFVENINALFRTNFALKHILLPLGISFFTLQQISFLIDRHWGSAPHYGIIDYASYVTFFPQLIAGPIVFHSELIPQFKDESKRRFNPENLRDGAILFILGLAKKVLIADFFAIPVNYGFDMILHLDTPSAWLVALSYTFELYFDFSGYCDMAVGLGKMFNLDLPINFKSPYKSHSVPEYWTRWHYTLTRFFTQYIYTPLTVHGVRKKKRKLYAFITPLIVYFISGFWHGASWTFILWGLAQGVATIWSQRKFFKLKKNFLTWICTFIFAIITQAIFRSETVPNMVRILKAMFVPSYNGFLVDMGSTMSSLAIFRAVFEKILTPSYPLVYWIYFVCILIGFAIAGFILKGRNAIEILAYRREKGITVGFTLFLAVLLVVSLVSMTGVSTFLYFNF